MAPVCATVLLFAALADLPAGSCALVCELRGAFIAVEAYDRGKAMTRDGGWFDAYRAGGRWMMALESEPEQCWLGGFDRWTGAGIEAGQ
jgi:hypothetical protein